MATDAERHLPEWSRLLRQQRVRRGLTQRRLAELAGLSEESVAKYEAALRLPSRRTLLRLARALGLEIDTTNQLLTARSLDQEPTSRMEAVERRRGPLVDLVREAGEYAWPCLIVNERFEIVGWNAPAETVAEFDFAAELPEHWQRNFMRIATHDHFRPRVLNWEEVVSQIIGMYKGHDADPANAHAASTYFAALVNDLATNRYVADVMRLWAGATPFADGRRLTLPIGWRPSDGVELHFNTVFTSWSDFDAAFAHDWDPADSATWRWLQGVASNQHSETAATSGQRAGAASEPDAATWNELLTRSRAGSRLTRKQVDSATGISYDALYAYESGRRRPSRDVLLRLARLYALDVATTNLILTALAEPTVPSDWALFMAGEPPRHGSEWYRGASRLPLDWAQIDREVHAYSWPCLVVDQRCDIQIWNAPAVEVFGDELLRGGRRRGEQNLARLILSPDFRRRALNWAEVINGMLPASLKQALTRPDGNRGSPALAALANDLNAASPDLVQELESVWNRSTPESATVRVVLTLAWQADEDAPLIFDCIIAPWTSYEPAWAIEFHPADADTWQWFERRR